MKQIFTLFFFFVGFFSQAQFTVATQEGTAITDGAIFTYNVYGTPPLPNGSDLSFNVTSSSSNAMNIRFKYVSNLNTDGSGANLCIFGSCFLEGAVQVGDIWSSTIEAGGTIDNGDHFYNSDSGSGTYPIEYVFKFYEVDGDENEIGDSISFTYRYDGTASIEDIARVEFKLYPTVSTDFVNLKISESVVAKLINTNGQILKEYAFTKGTHQIDISVLSNQIYYLILTNNKGQRSLAKIIKQ